MDIAAALGTERLREVMSALLSRSRAVVERYGGTVDFIGDGIMAIFGAPIALEDHAFEAVWRQWTSRSKHGLSLSSCAGVTTSSCNCVWVSTRER